MDKKLKKLNYQDKILGQYSKGGSHKEIPVWPKQKIVETPTEKVHRFVYRWTFTINWAEVILWTIILVSLYLLR